MTIDREPSGIVWRKSSYSNGSGGDCVEVARVRAEKIGVRDSKSAGGPVLAFAGAAWESFITDLRGSLED